MHSFAWVFCGNQKSSWHGTTVQVTQPLPSLSLPERPTKQFEVPCSDTHVSLTGIPHGQWHRERGGGALGAQAPHLCLRL